MKKTLFLTAILGLTSQALAVNGAPLKPQTIMSISGDATLESIASDTVTFSALKKIDDATVRNYLEQARQNVGTFVDADETKSFRPVVVKEGQGTLTFSGDAVNAVTPFAVREGTVKILNTVNLNWGNGSAISVAGTNALLIVDGGTVNLTGSTGGTSVAVGGMDGDGALILKNQAEMKMAQSLFSGSGSFFPFDTPGAAPFHGVETHLGGTYVSLYGSADDEYNALLYRDYAKDTAFSDKREAEDGTRNAHGSIDVLGGSSLKLGQSLYAGNTVVTISGSFKDGDTVNASTLETGLDTPNYTFDSIGWGAGAETTLNITNGGKFISNSVRLDIGAGENSVAYVNVTDGSTLEQKQQAYVDGNKYDSKVAYKAGSKAVLNVVNDSQVSYSGNLQVAYGQASEATINVAEESDFTVTGKLQVAYGQASEATINVRAESIFSAAGTIYLNIYDDTSATINVVDRSSFNANGEEMWLCYGGNCESTINVKDHSSLTASGALVTNDWNNGNAKILVDEYSTLSAKQLVLNNDTFNYYEKEGSNNVSILRVNDHSSVTATYAAINYDATAKALVELTNHSTATFTTMEMGANSTLTVDETSTLLVRQGYLYDGATLINHGQLGNSSYGFIALYGGSRLQSGEVLVSGCEALVDEEHKMKSSYNSGLGSWMLPDYGAKIEGSEDDSGIITIGALLTGKDQMQYLFSRDMQTINKQVFDSLLMFEHENYTIAYKHEIGENITMNYTTDHLNKVTGTESIAVKGGAILVEQGEGKHHDGTIGSYENVATETQAAIAVHEHTTGSKVTWEGTGLHTVAGEKATLSKGNHVNVTPKEGLGTLTVVTASELLVAGGVNAGGITVENGAQLTNNGTLNAAVTVEGVLNGSGVITGNLTVNENGKLIVGNSPGYQNVTGNVKLAGGSNTVFCIAGTTAASEGHTGWTSGTASQICIANGALTLDANANVTIEFGGAAMINDGMFGLDQEFSVVLVKGGCDELAGQLTSLLAHTTFVLTSDAEGLTGLAVPESGVISVSGAQYRIEDSNLVLTGTLTYTPEPTTATLSLLALAGLAARRRRK